MFFKFLFLISFFDNKISVKGILGGTEIDIDEAPYQVNYGDVCGGVLIDKKWVLTTAHCGTEQFIRVGDKHRLRGLKVNIRKHVDHPLYGKKHEFDYDIQLLQLTKSLRLNDNIKPIKISDGFYSKHIHVAGWGYPKEKGDYQDTLHQVELKMVRIQKCQKVKQKWWNHTLTSRMFCAGGSRIRDACQGDSGSAAVSFGHLIGISSFGYGCGRDVPGVYINVSEPSIREWITNYTGV